jgi:ABC-type glycerol-3-phosphate transport system substrate-binding protein
MSAKQITRRDFLKATGMTLAGAALTACVPAAATATAPAAPAASAVPAATAVPAAVATGVPTVVKARKVQVAVGGWAEKVTKDLLASTTFTKDSGIEVEIVLRTDTKETEFTRLASAVQAGTSPYDVIDFEDELTTSFSQAGYVIGLDDILPKDMWDDFSPEMVAYSKKWSAYNGQTFRVIHNWEMPYWWYRKDWFDAKKVEVPKTWDDVAKMGEVFTDEKKGVWATSDGLQKGALLNVYLAWITLQAGGNAFEVGDPYKTGLQYIYDLMHTKKALNPAALQKDYNMVNADYIADKVAFMRQWPFFGDVARSPDNKAWFSDDKVAVALPPVGPGGKAGSTYPAAWGFGIVKTAPHMDEAKEFVKWMCTKETAVAAMKAGFWYLNARKSVLAAADQNNYLVKMIKMYTDAGVIGVRPFHPKFVEALTVLEDNAAAYLTDQIKLDQALSQTKDALAKLA